jgi:orotate phosphoribosyltransferase
VEKGKMERVKIEEINPRDYDKVVIPEEQIFFWFGECDAVWVHDENPKSPHAELTSGFCSNAFFDCMRALCHPNMNEIFAIQLVKKLRKLGINNVDWVIGSDHAAATFSYEIAKAFGACHDFVEKDPTDTKGKRMLWKRLTIPEGSVVFDAEELITTSKTFKEVRRAVVEGNSETVKFLPIVGAIIHRPPELPARYEIDGTEIKIVSLVEKEVWAVDPNECPLCEAGSKRYRPKTHWSELTGK